MRTSKLEINAFVAASFDTRLEIDIPAEQIETVLAVHRAIVRHLEQTLHEMREEERQREIRLKEIETKRAENERLNLKLAREQKRRKLSRRTIANALGVDLELARTIMQNARGELQRRRRAAIQQAIIEAWIQGLGVREIARTLTRRFGSGASPATVSRVIREHIAQNAPKLPLRLLHVVK